MAKRILICTELSPAELRAKALAAGTARDRKRGLAIAHVMEGMSRIEAGRLTDQTDQAVKDAIRRYNAEGLAGLKDRPHTGRPRKLEAERREERQHPAKAAGSAVYQAAALIAVAASRAAFQVHGSRSPRRCIG